MNGTGVGVGVAGREKQSESFHDIRGWDRWASIAQSVLVSCS